jgi:hypothetical protein
MVLAWNSSLGGKDDDSKVDEANQASDLLGMACADHFARRLQPEPDRGTTANTISDPDRFAVIGINLAAGRQDRGIGVGG